MRRLVLWGQHLEEYRDMFGLSDSDFKHRFLEYNCGVSAFNSDLHKKSIQCVSCDPWFSLNKPDITSQIKSSFDERLLQLQNNIKNIDVSRYGSIDKLVVSRLDGIAKFLADYETGLKENRYLGINATELPFETSEFNFALVANNFFNCCDLSTIDHHLVMIKELARVAKEVRIFPLVDANGEPSPLLGPILLKLNQANYGVEVRDVSYHLQPRGNAMLRVWAKQCQIS